MTRAFVLQQLIKKKKYRRYLEIGIYKGKTFLPLDCKYKIAVEPVLKISPVYWLKWILKNPRNLQNKYFFMTSEAFFRRKRNYLTGQPEQDLIFIDGLHTFRASLEDVLNSLQYLSKDGTIVLHDCFPPNKAAATPAKSYEQASSQNIPGWTGAWCGDVWKTIAYLKKEHSENLDIIVLDTDLGLGIIKITSDNNFPVQIQEDKFKDIDALDYNFLIEDPDVRIGLKRPGHWNSVLD